MTASGFLDAWVDFNQDGDWNDEGEQIFASRALVAGENPLQVNVAGTAKPGLSAARFRFSSQGSLAPSGVADDGEVEDYMLAITKGKEGGKGSQLNSNNELRPLLFPAMRSCCTSFSPRSATRTVCRFTATPRSPSACGCGKRASPAPVTNC